MTATANAPPPDSIFSTTPDVVDLFVAKISEDTRVATKLPRHVLMIRYRGAIALMPKAIITVHGIRTFGSWQKRLEGLIGNQSDITFYHFKYNYFSVLAFIFPLTRWIMVRRFRRELRDVCRINSTATIDLVGHSFGTHLVGWGLSGLATSEPIKIDTLILAGSVLRADFYWAKLIPNRVRRVINDCGIADSILLLSQLGVPFAGMAGRTGFVGMNGPGFINRYSNFGHSGYFLKDGKDYDDYMRENWVPLLTTNAPPLSFDARTTPSAWGGFVMWLTNNFEPIKILIFTLPLLLFSIFVGALYLRGEAIRDRTTTVANLATSMKFGSTLPKEAEPLLDTLKQALSIPLVRTPVLWVDDKPNGNFRERQDLMKFGLCFALAKNTDEAVAMLQANPGKFAVLVSNFARMDDPKEGYGLLNEIKAKNIDIPLIYYSFVFTDDQARDAVAKGAKAELRDPIELLSLVLRLLPAEAKDPSNFEIISQKLFGCRGLWKST
jgi:CheY-like chemotaxis protein